ncbi:MAG: DUF4340 domain-containing protein [Deltaproteobacteria bacterium]|nr:DUF4340 domain-containing protein [Deltaproteobacteria bacterium]
MTWRTTLVYWVLLGLLAGYYAAVESKARPVSEIVVAREKVLGVYADEVMAITLRRDGQDVRCERRDKRWTMVQPRDAKVPADLISVLVDNLTEKQEAEEISAAPPPEELRAFGLADASTVLEVELAGGKTASVKLGARNPPQTAVYAQTSLSPRVLLVGLNVQYYADLLHEAGRVAAASSASGKN